MTQTEQHLSFAPPFGALNTALDAFYVYFHLAGGFAAVLLHNPKESRAFGAQGLPLCSAGLTMPLKSTYTDYSHLFPPSVWSVCLFFGFSFGYQPCPLAHANDVKDGCVPTLPTNMSTRIRQQLDRDSVAYQRIFAQRTASEHINL